MESTKSQGYIHTVHYRSEFAFERWPSEAVSLDVTASITQRTCQSGCLFTHCLAVTGLEYISVFVGIEQVTVPKFL